MGKEYQMIAKTFNGLENVLAEELVKLGANDVRIDRRAVSFTGDKALMYRANLYLRSASRVLKPLLTFKAKNADEVYEQVKTIDWGCHLNVRQTFAIDTTVYSEEFRNSQFVKYRVKDAIADWFMEHEEKRPSIRIDNPDIRLNVHISHDQCTVSLDSSGESLHKRGYRDAQTDAPINEALAAGLLLMAGWDGQTDFVDPMCGSGTFLIEAALIALNIPPCIYRKEFAFEKWADFDPELFDFLYNDDSNERTFDHKIIGCDISPRALKVAEANIKAAGLGKYITLERRDIADWTPQTEPCLVVTNPPYGERLVSDDLVGLYEQIGTSLKRNFAGSTAWIISSNDECVRKIGLHASQKVEVLNGALECKFLKYELFSGKRNNFVAERKSRPHDDKSRPHHPERNESDDDRTHEKFDRKTRREWHRDDDRRPAFAQRNERRYNDRPPFEDRHNRNDRNDRYDRRPKFVQHDDERPNFEKRDDKPRFRRFDDRSKFDDRPKFDRKPHFGDRSHFDDERKPRRFQSDKPDFGSDKKPFGSKRNDRHDDRDSQARREQAKHNVRGYLRRKK